MYSANNIIANKHNASGTGKEQACDLGKVFPISKKLNKSTTVEHIPSSNHHLKRHLELQFAKFNSKLRIKKHSAIIGYLAKQPTILSRSCVRENVLSGYVASGFVDPIHFRMPVLFKLLSTCKKVCNLHEYNKYLYSFPSLMALSYNNANQYLSDADFISHGFYADIDAYGNEKIRDATISQENQQRGEGGFGKRLKTHLERASSDRNDDDSHFYHYFPFKSSEHAKSYSKEGYFEYLTAYVGVGFSAECPPECFSKPGGLLMFTKEEEKWI
jgi:hypothetical protein